MDTGSTDAPESRVGVYLGLVLGSLPALLAIVWLLVRRCRKQHPGSGTATVTVPTEALYLGTVTVVCEDQDAVDSSIAQCTAVHDAAP
jgi:hypothetical protein